MDNILKFFLNVIFIVLFVLLTVVFVTVAKRQKNRGAMR